uniref:Uncharacterized protein n=1 Tax=Staphylococcus phage HS04 TaxID=3056398 RepID=A0AA50ACP8_9VIRU|nr:MAG: hypothetical protein [Staphylococcus phage HS04]DAL31817.1 MAG TPA_asm: hypothetical protein [Caudoviricetes sp.]DAX45375.1 MAG TPA: hypothetical protein [Caudoviricetes sp.]
MSKLVKVLYTHITRFKCHISIQKPTRLFYRIGS